MKKKTKKFFERMGRREGVRLVLNGVEHLIVIELKKIVCMNSRSQLPHLLNIKHITADTVNIQMKSQNDKNNNSR